MAKIRAELKEQSNKNVGLDIDVNYFVKKAENLLYSPVNPDKDIQYRKGRSTFGKKVSRKGSIL